MRRTAIVRKVLRGGAGAPGLGVQVVSVNIGVAEHSIEVRSGAYVVNQTLGLRGGLLHTSFEASVDWVLRRSIEFGEALVSSESGVVVDWMPLDSCSDLDALFLEAIIEAMCRIGDIRVESKGAYHFDGGQKLGALGAAVSPDRHALAEGYFKFGSLVADYRRQLDVRDAAILADQRRRRAVSGGHEKGIAHSHKMASINREIERYAIRARNSAYSVSSNYSQWARVIHEMAQESDDDALEGYSVREVSLQYVRKYLSGRFPKPKRTPKA